MDNVYLTVNALIAKLTAMVAEEPAVGEMLVDVTVETEGAGGIASRITVTRNTALYGDVLSIEADLWDSPPCPRRETR